MNFFIVMTTALIGISFLFLSFPVKRNKPTIKDLPDSWGTEISTGRDQQSDRIVGSAVSEGTGNINASEGSNFATSRGNSR